MVARLGGSNEARVGDRGLWVRVLVSTAVLAAVVALTGVAAAPMEAETAAADIVQVQGSHADTAVYSVGAASVDRTPSVRTPVPDSLYAYPEQRVGVVAFGTQNYDVLSLNPGFLKFEDRGPRWYV